MRKIIKNTDLVPIVIQDLILDSTPTEGSTNPVTSDGVKGAIDGAVGDASEALQEQIDDIAEKAGSGYIPKGESDVATLNGLSGQENGWLYTLTDSGTLTDGSLAVVAGDTVAWDATNSVWYKAMDYAPAEYGTNEVHNLPTTITDFRTGDVIPVDGPSGTAKMKKDDLLREAAENATSTLVQDALNDDDFDISDENGNVLARFRDGNILVKNFDSSEAPVAIDNPLYDFVISDELKNILFAISKGHIKTKNFDSEKQVIVDDVVYPDFSITDKQGNILFEIVGGHIKTKNFDSSTYGSVGVDRYENPTSSPLDKLISSASMVRIFDSIGVVGASFDSGEIEYMDGGVKHYLDRYDNAWGTRLAKMNGNECEIFAYGGQTAINWVKNSSEYNAPDGLPHTERTWAGLKAATQKKAYVIQLGGNDANNIWRYSAGVGDCSTDIGVYDPETDTDTNAESYAGYMAGIIQRIKSVQPRAKIFVCTMQRWTRDDSFGVSLDNVVRDLPNYFTDVFLVDFRTYQPPKSAELSEMYLAGGHPNEAGHVWLTDNYNTYIDWIIRTNFSLFNDVQLIGTNYTLPT